MGAVVEAPVVFSPSARAVQVDASNGTSHPSPDHVTLRSSTNPAKRPKLIRCTRVRLERTVGDGVGDAVVGAAVGASVVGAAVGLSVGCAVGDCVGADVGADPLNHTSIPLINGTALKGAIDMFSHPSVTLTVVWNEYAVLNPTNALMLNGGLTSTPSSETLNNRPSAAISSAKYIVTAYTAAVGSGSE